MSPVVPVVGAWVPVAVDCEPVSDCAPTVVLPWSPVSRASIVGGLGCECVRRGGSEWGLCDEPTLDWDEKKKPAGGRCEVLYTHAVATRIFPGYSVVVSPMAERNINRERRSGSFVRGMTRVEGVVPCDGIGAAMERQALISMAEVKVEHWGTGVQGTGVQGYRGTGVQGFAGIHRYRMQSCGASHSRSTVAVWRYCHGQRIA